MEEGLTLTSKEQARLKVLNGVLVKLWSAGQAAEILGISERHVWRLLAAYREEGAAALAIGQRLTETWPGPGPPALTTGGPRGRAGHTSKAVNSSAKIRVPS
ncbi:MAG: helix-turn-helix domain-containing protein [Dehalococcoidia bacterium]